MHVQREKMSQDIKFRIQKTKVSAKPENQLVYLVSCVRCVVGPVMYLKMIDPELLSESFQAGTCRD